MLFRSWSVDSLKVEEQPEPRVWVHNSLMLSRRTEQVLRLDKFRPDGSLKVRVWYLRSQIVSTPDGATARVPSEMMFWYPHPLENSIIRLELQNMKVNVALGEGRFKME